MAKSFLFVQVSLLVASFFTVFAQELDTVSFVALPPHYHSVAPALAPKPPHHHHHHHHQSHPPTAVPAHAPAPHHHHHHYSHPPAHSPTHAPAHAPAHAPVHAPAHAPVHPPHIPPTQPPSYHFQRALVAVQGVVYCKSCKYAGADTLLGATPVLGAVVKLQCNNTKYPLNVQAKTDKNGYFYLRAPKTITSYGAHKCKAFLVSSPSASCQKPSTLHGGVTGAVLRAEKSFVDNKLPYVLYTVGPLAFEPKCPH